MAGIRNPLARAALAALAVAGATACATNPVTGRPELVLMSRAREQELSREAAEQVAAEMGLVSDPQLLDYVDRVGQRVAARSPRRDVSYAFQVLDTPEPNAFALPGGHVYVSRGLLALANAEAELANVLGHEIAHVAARHAAQRQTRGVGVGLVLLPAAVAGAALGVAIGAPGDLLGAAVNAPLRLAGSGLIAAYGRDQEREADRVGQALVAESGTDPRGLAQFMGTLEAYEELTTGEARRRPGFFDTHPSTPERVANAAGRADELEWTPAPGIAADRAEFLSHLEGIRVGASPAEGVFEGSRFLHPDLDLTLVFPEGWTLVNARAGVAAFAPERDAQIVLEIDGEGGDPKAAAGRALESLGSDTSVEVVAVEDLTIGPHPATRARLRASPGPGQAPLAIEVTWIAKQGLVYRISAVGERAASERHQAALAAVPASFRALDAAERARIRDTRLRVVEAREGESLAGLCERSGNAWSEAETAVANGLAAGAPLATGQRVKVAVEQPYRAETP